MLLLLLLLTNYCGDKDTYSTSGSNVTFSTAPLNTTEIEIIHYVSVDGVIEVDELVGDGTTTSFNTSLSIVNENATQVYISGVYQSKLTYQTTGNNVAFTTAPPNGANIEVVHTKALALSGFEKNNFTGTRYHSLIIDRKTLNKNFIITAKTKDNVIMGIMHKKYNLHGVQFHPESISTKEGMKLIRNFLNYK